MDIGNHSRGSTTATRNLVSLNLSGWNSGDGQRVRLVRFAGSQSGTLATRSQDIFLRSKSVSGPDPSKSTMARPKAECSKKGVTQELDKNRQKEDGNSNAGFELKTVYKQVPGNIMDLREKIYKVLQALGRLEKEKVEIEQKRRDAYAQHDECGLKKAEVETKAVRNKKIPLLETLEALLKKHGKRGPNKLVPIQISVPKPGRKKR
jgi:chromosome segregation ATPase